MVQFDLSLFFSYSFAFLFTYFSNSSPLPPSLSLPRSLARTFKACRRRLLDRGRQLFDLIAITHNLPFSRPRPRHLSPAPATVLPDSLRIDSQLITYSWRLPPQHAGLARASTGTSSWCYRSRHGSTHTSVDIVLVTHTLSHIHTLTHTHRSVRHP